MTNNEYLELLMIARNDNQEKQFDEQKACEVASLVSGSFCYHLYESLLQADVELDAITEHLENLHNTSNHYGLVYFIIMLADSIGFELPTAFIEMTFNDNLVPIISAELIEDWLDIDE